MLLGALTYVYEKKILKEGSPKRFDSFSDFLVLSVWALHISKTFKEGSPKRFDSVFDFLVLHVWALQISKTFKEGFLKCWDEPLVFFVLFPWEFYREGKTLKESSANADIWPRYLQMGQLSLRNINWFKFKKQLDLDWFCPKSPRKLGGLSKSVKSRYEDISTIPPSPQFMPSQVFCVFPWEGWECV